MDDDLRWLVALVSDNGMRLAETAGLTREDIVQGDDGSFVARVRPHPWRRLKTKGSERDDPLERAAGRVLGQNPASKFAFPRYNKSTSTNANAASAPLNKWMKEHVPAGNTLHGFRHSMRDRLRAVECLADVVDQIGGGADGRCGSWIRVRIPGRSSQEMDEGCHVSRHGLRRQAVAKN